MATLKDIDHDRDIYICPTIEAQIDAPEIVEIATQQQNPNLLRCDTPVANKQITLTGMDARQFLEWLASTQWGAAIEDDLQCVSQTAAGEPLLSSWLPLHVFEALAADAGVANALPSMTDSIEDWRSLHVRRVYIDGFQMQ